MPKRNQRLDYLLTPAQRKRLRKVWAEFHAVLGESFDNDNPIERALHMRKLNKLRAQFPPGGLGWPFWQMILSEESAAPTLIGVDVGQGQDRTVIVETSRAKAQQIFDTTTRMIREGAL